MMTSEFACFNAHVLENCGPMVRAATTEIGRRANVLWDCPSDMKEEFLGILSRLDITEDQRRELQDILSMHAENY